MWKIWNIIRPIKSSEAYIVLLYQKDATRRISVLWTVKYMETSSEAVSRHSQVTSHNNIIFFVWFISSSSPSFTAFSFLSFLLCELNTWQRRRTWRTLLVFCLFFLVYTPWQIRDYWFSFSIWRHWTWPFVCFISSDSITTFLSLCFLFCVASFF